MNKFIPLRSCNYLYKILTKGNKAIDNFNSWNETDTEENMKFE